MDKRYILREDVKGKVDDDVVIVKKVKDVVVKGSTVTLYSPEKEEVRKLDLLGEEDKNENGASDKG